MGQCITEARETRPATVDKGEFYTAITTWVENRRAADALTREEIGELDAFDRLDAQRKGLLIGLVQYYRTHKNADVAPGLMALGYHLSDNQDGACKISQTRMARLFSRSRQAVKDGLDRLDREGLISFNGQTGRVSMVVPVIPRALACRNHIVWMLDAVESAMGKPVNPAWQVENGKRLAKRSNNTRKIAAPEVISGNTCQGGLAGGESEPAKPGLQVYVKSEEATCQAALTGTNGDDASNLSTRLGTNSLIEKKQDISPLPLTGEGERETEKLPVLVLGEPILEEPIATPATKAAEQPQLTLIPDALRDAPPPKRAKAKNKAPAYTDEFNAFWTRYERKVGKAEAFKAWLRLSADDQGLATLAATAYFASRPSKAAWGVDYQYALHASTFLNQRRFDDYAAAAVAQSAAVEQEQIKAVALDIDRSQWKFGMKWWKTASDVPASIMERAHQFIAENFRSTYANRAMH